MNTNIIHVGLDVDDTQYHGSALDKNTGEVIDPFEINFLAFFVFFKLNGRIIKTRPELEIVSLFIS